MLENQIASMQEVNYFYKNTYEIDFVIEEDEKIKAVEIKLEAKKLRQIKKFLSDKKFSKKDKEGIIVDLEKECEENGIKIIPTWKFLLLREEDKT